MRGHIMASDIIEAICLFFWKPTGSFREDEEEIDD